MKTAAILLGLFSAALTTPSLREDSVSIFLREDSPSISLRDDSVSISLSVDPTECVQQHCPDQYAVCSKDPKCIPAIQSCQSQCQDKVSCWQFCLVKKGDQPAIDVAKCAAANHCLGEIPEVVVSTAVALMDDPTDCIKQHCPNEYDACQKDSKCLPAIQDCEKKCGTKQTCWEFCLGGKGDQPAINVAKCAAANKCM